MRLPIYAALPLREEVDKPPYIFYAQSFFAETIPGLRLPP